MIPAAAIDEQFDRSTSSRHSSPRPPTACRARVGPPGHDSLGDRLLTFQLYDQQANVPPGIIPSSPGGYVEHASYLQYKNVKADYVKAFWNVVNWEDVQNPATRRLRRRPQRPTR